MFGAPVIQNVTESLSNPSVTVEKLENVIQKLPKFEETPLLDGCLLVLNQQDVHSGTVFTLAQVTRIQKVELPDEFVWIIGIIFVMDYRTFNNNYYKSKTDYIQLFKDKSNRYNFIAPPTVINQPPERQPQDEHLDQDSCEDAEQAQEEQFPEAEQAQEEQVPDDFV